MNCEHGAILIHLPSTHIADAQSGVVPLAHVTLQSSE
jgi:hypothetical protein